MTISKILMIDSRMNHIFLTLQFNTIPHSSTNVHPIMPDPTQSCSIPLLRRSSCPLLRIVVDYISFVIYTWWSVYLYHFCGLYRCLAAQNPSSPDDYQMRKCQICWNIHECFVIICFFILWNLIKHGFETYHLENLMFCRFLFLLCPYAFCKSFFMSMYNWN